MALVKLAFVGLCVFLCLSLSSANTDGASSRSINGGGDDDGDDDDRFPKMSLGNNNRASSISINVDGDDDGDDDNRFPKMSFANTNIASSNSINGGGDDDDRFPKMSFANTNRASSNSINGGGDDDPRSPKMMPSGTAKHPVSGSAHLRRNGFGFGACQNPNRPVTVEYPCPGYGSICNPSPCYPSPPSYGCQPCNQAQTNMAQKANMNNGPQDSPKAATETMPRASHKQ